MKAVVASVIAAIAFLVGTAMFTNGRSSSPWHTPNLEVPQGSNGVSSENEGQAEWNYLRGKEASRKGDHDLASSYFDESLRLRPTHAKTLRERSICRAMSRDFDGARRDAAEAIRLSNDAIDISHGYSCHGFANWYGGAPRNAIKDCSEAIRLNPSNCFAYLIRADSFLDEKNLDGSIRDANECIRLDPDCDKAWRTRGKAYMMKGDYPQAISSLTRAIEKQPSALSYSLRASCHWLQNATSKAVPDAQRATELDPSNEMAHLVLSQVFESMGDRRRSEEHVAKLEMIRQHKKR